jgi:aminoglycoside phosphotransferase (APT) family kinase protein
MKKNATAREIDKFRRLARDAAKHHFGGYPKRIVHRSEGLSNFVFTFSNSDGEFVIRISPDPSRINSFIKEQWAENAAREADVPTPRILEVGHELIRFPYMIAHMVPGREATHHPNRLDILREMGRYAAVINSIRTKGFGQTFDWSENRLSFNSTLKEYLYNEFRFEEKLASLVRHKMIAEKRSKELARIFADAAKSRTRPVLNHGDMRLKNVIVSEEGRIKAIIDWEGCTSNVAPAWELSLALHDLGVDGMQCFLEGYGLSEKRFLDALPLIKAFNIVNYAAAVDEIAAAKDKKMLAQYRLRLSGAFDLYSL